VVGSNSHRRRHWPWRQPFYTCEWGRPPTHQCLCDGPPPWGAPPFFFFLCVYCAWICFDSEATEHGDVAATSAGMLLAPTRRSDAPSHAVSRMSSMTMASHVAAAETRTRCIRRSSSENPPRSPEFRPYHTAGASMTDTFARPSPPTPLAAADPQGDPLASGRSWIREQEPHPLCTFRLTSSCNEPSKRTTESKPHTDRRAFIVLS